ncbi:MAG: anti-sigma factor RsbA family regulatory protein [Acidimicrobiales bacterium]
MRPRREFKHEAFFYSGTDDFVAGVSSFIRDGVGGGEPTLVVLAVDKLAAIQDELGGDPPGVWFADMATVGHNPARLIPAWHDFVDEHLGRGVGLRGVGEPIRPNLGRDLLVESQHHEALLNLAFPALLDLWLLCPYDAADLAPGILDEARRNHPTILEDGARRDSGIYQDVAALGSPPGDPLPEPPTGTVEVRFDASCLSTVRVLVADQARRAGLGADREADLVLSVNEIAANSIQYGGGSGTLHIWRDESAVVCEIRDAGTISDPLVGRLAPGTSPESSRGLWVVNQLCDLVQVRSSSAGTAVRLHMSLGGRRPRA